MSLLHNEFTKRFYIQCTTLNAVYCSTDLLADLNLSIAINMRGCFMLTDFRVTLYLLLSTAYHMASELV
jgi:hypothetical protein